MRGLIHAPLQVISRLLSNWNFLCTSQRGAEPGLWQDTNGRPGGVPVGAADDPRGAAHAGSHPQSTPT